MKALAVVQIPNDGSLRTQLDDLVDIVNRNDVQEVKICGVYLGNQCIEAVRGRLEDVVPIVIVLEDLCK